MILFVGLDRIQIAKLKRTSSDLFCLFYRRASMVWNWSTLSYDKIITSEFSSACGLHSFASRTQKFAIRWSTRGLDCHSKLEADVKSRMKRRRPWHVKNVWRSAIGHTSVTPAAESMFNENREQVRYATLSQLLWYNTCDIAARSCHCSTRVVSTYPVNHNLCDHSFVISADCF